MSGDSPDTIRGNNLGFAWTDETAHWPKLEKAWEMLEYALRLGKRPRTINTTTPLGRPEFLRLVFECDDSGRPVSDAAHETGFRPLAHARVVTGSSYANAANLSPEFITNTLARKAGTALGQQEIGGVVLLDVVGALWRWSDFTHCEPAPKHDRRVVAVDPSGGTRNAGNAETGIIEAGLVGQRVELLRDASGHHEPEAWGRAVIDLYDLDGCEAIVAETNFGAEMVRATIDLVSRLPETVRERRARGTERPIKIEEVNASAAWHERAAYVQPLWRSKVVVHAGDPREWVELEHQMRHGDPTRPKKGQRLDRLDAAVHAVTWLTTQRAITLPALSPTAVGEFWATVAAGLR
jgi:phage terminase large subunit-like protein